MQKHTDEIMDQYGNAMAGVPIFVTTEAGAEAILFADDEVTRISNPVRSDSKGQFSFKAANGKYRAKTQSASIRPDVPYGPFILFDPDDFTGVSKEELAYSSGASLIGFVPFQSAQSVELDKYLNGDTNIIPSARGYWVDEAGGANIHRLRDRVFIGTAAASSGKKIQGPSETWLASDIGAYWMERGAQTLSLSSYGQFGGLFAARTSDQDLHNYGTAAIGVAGVANNDRTSGLGLAWGGYFEVNRQASLPSGQGTCYGIELAVKNNKEDVTNGPYNRFPGGATIGIWLAGGGDPSYNGPGTAPVTAAVLIGKNGATWNKGIVFDAAGITGTDGTTGTGIAISMAKGHVIEWEIPGGLQGATIFSAVSINAQRSGIQFQNDQVWFTAAGSLVGTVEKGAGTASYLRMISGASGGIAQLKVTSSDTNADLMLSPQGTGVLRLNYSTAAAATPANFAASRSLAFKDAAGTTYYIPLAAAPW